MFTFCGGSEGSTLKNLTIDFTSAESDSAAVWFTQGFKVDGETTTVENVTFVGRNALEDVVQESAIIAAPDTEAHIIVKNCSITNFKYGMYFNQAKNLEVMGNTINGTHYNGIVVDKAVADHSVKITGNTLKDVASKNYTTDPFFNSGISFGESVVNTTMSENNIALHASAADGENIYCQGAAFVGNETALKGALADERIRTSG